MAAKQHSEFGGAPGRIQPAPHDIADVPYEQHRLMMTTDTTDPADTIEAALVRERVREGNA